jgi:hypothetical protein
MTIFSSHSKLRAYKVCNWPSRQITKTQTSIYTYVIFTIAINFIVPFCVEESYICNRSSIKAGLRERIDDHKTCKCISVWRRSRLRTHGYGHRVSTKKLEIEFTIYSLSLKLLVSACVAATRNMFIRSAQESDTTQNKFIWYWGRH